MPPKNTMYYAGSSPEYLAQLEKAKAHKGGFIEVKKHLAPGDIVEFAGVEDTHFDIIRGTYDREYYGGIIFGIIAENGALPTHGNLTCIDDDVLYERIYLVIWGEGERNDRAT